MTTARDRPPEEAAEDTSFARGLRVLLTIADRGEIRADELSAVLETPLSTVYRYLRTLADFGFVDHYGAGYRLGPRLVIGSGANVTSEELIRLAIPVLHMLVEETGETAVISRRVGLSAVCLHEVQSRHPLRVTVEPGTAVSLREGALARVLLAYAPPEILEEVLGQDAETTDPSRADATSLRAALADIVSSGMSRSTGEDVRGTVTIAAPILRADGIVGAIGVTGPEDRCGTAWRMRVARLLPDAARSISGGLPRERPFG